MSNTSYTLFMEIALIIAGIVIAPFVFYFGLKLFWSIPKVLHWIAFVAVTVLLLAMLGKSGEIGWSFLLVGWGGLWFLLLAFGAAFGFLGERD